MTSKLTASEKDTIANLRDSGFAVVLFNPTEIAGIDPRVIESELVSVGNEIIQAFKESGEYDES